MRADTGRLRVVAHDVAEAEALLPDELAELPEPALVERDDDLPSPGAYIEQQRLRRGMSIEQLAVVTKIPARSIEHLEADRFEELPGQVFVKGFLRCCARALGVSQQAVMDLLYERERAALVARRKDRDRQPEPAADKAGRNPVAPREAKPAEAKARPKRRAPGRAQVAPEPPLGPRLPPRLSRSSTPVRGPGPVDRLKELVPSAHALLWIVVAIFVAFMVLAAFNLAGAPGGMPQS